MSVTAEQDKIIKRVLAGEAQDYLEDLKQSLENWEQVPIWLGQKTKESTNE